MGRILFQVPLWPLEVQDAITEESSRKNYRTQIRSRETEGEEIAMRCYSMVIEAARVL